MSLLDKDYVYFILNQDFIHRRTTGFDGYLDIDGNPRYIYDGRRDKKNNPTPRKFNFSKRDRAMRVPKNQKDIFGKSVVEFLRESPDCKGSVLNNKRGNGVWLYKELNEEADAQVALDVKFARIEAENKAIALEGEDLRAVAIMLGEFSGNEVMQQHRVLDYAGSDPIGFLEVIESPDFKLKALIRKGIQVGTLKQVGELITWGDATIGANEAEAVSRLMSDEELHDAVNKAVKKDS